MVEDTLQGKVVANLREEYKKLISWQWIPQSAMLLVSGMIHDLDDRAKLYGKYLLEQRHQQ